MIGLYYDNPNAVSDKTQCRSSIGLMINDGQSFKVSEFLESHPSFLSAHLPTTKCITTSYPYVNKLSFLLIVAKVYPKLAKYIQEQRIQTGGSIMEIYHLLSNSGNTVEVMAPLENFEYFSLWEDDNNLIPVRNPRKT